MPSRRNVKYLAIALLSVLAAKQIFLKPSLNSIVDDSGTFFLDHNIHFRTYGNDAFVKSKQRIVKEANGTGWFKTVKALGPEDLSDSFRLKYKDILSKHRGGGYWIWRFEVIELTMATMQEGDFLVMLDAGSHLNKNGQSRFREYIQMFEDSHYDILAFQQIRYPEYKWTTHEIFAAFEVERNPDVTKSGQYGGNTLIFRKGPHYKSWIELCKSVIDMNPMIITDKYNREAREYNDEFRDNRHDQSIISVSAKMVGCITVDYDEADLNEPDKPFHITRMRE